MNFMDSLFFFDLHYTFNNSNIFLIIICCCFLFLFVCILLFLSFLLSPKIRDLEKNSPYECGFNPFEDTRSLFEIHFYRVAILFIIFDLEIAFLLPWVVVFDVLNFFGFWIMTIFLFLLTLGFVYELYSGALDWD